MSEDRDCPRFDYINYRSHEDRLRGALLLYMNIERCSISELARRVNIGKCSLIDFVKSRTKPSYKTLCSINNFISSL